MTTAIVWFRNDLRLHDNPSLRAALSEHDTVVPVYLWTPAEEQPWAPGAASRWWLHHSLEQLGAELERRGGKLHIRHGQSAAALLVDLCAETGASAVYAQRCYEPMLAKQEQSAAAKLNGVGARLQLAEGQTLLPLRASTKADGSPFRVFTPFWRNFMKEYIPSPPLPAPIRITMPQRVSTNYIADLGLLPRIAWDGGLRETWQPGASSALRALDRFATERIERYGKVRDLPAVVGTSRLSPHLRFGEISPRQIAWRLWQGLQAKDISAGAHETYFRQLVWREFAFSVLHHFPQTTDRPFNSRFNDFPWPMDRDDWFTSWRRGRTGFPIVDAGMRELWHTGWMHNRVRMIVASFLTKHCGISWLAGARWFWDTLVDADLANNSMGWQWSAGCGVDAAPYFRIFNPLRQGERFDPKGEYIRRWVPELRDAPIQAIHDPQRGRSKGLFDATYPEPILDLDERRQHALAVYRETRHHPAPRHV